ncbi:hypothetical protein GCM10008024_10970 [Allgaiera indica]|uniref:Uncharacterized protein n=1 Tax=Allgaiera indica TaxID=765699 RepID=A0AAN4UPJ7_9RHOB|nr:hypothetical protein GCM10008024_10970 [Allgaiera indica]
MIARGAESLGKLVLAQHASGVDGAGGQRANGKMGADCQSHGYSLVVGAAGSEWAGSAKYAVRLHEIAGMELTWVKSARPIGRPTGKATLWHPA